MPSSLSTDKGPHRFCQTFDDLLDSLILPDFQITVHTFSLPRGEKLVLRIYYSIPFLFLKFKKLELKINYDRSLHVKVRYGVNVMALFLTSIIRF